MNTNFSLTQVRKIIHLQQLLQDTGYVPLDDIDTLVVFNRRWNHMLNALTAFELRQKLDGCDNLHLLTLYGNSVRAVKAYLETVALPSHVFKDLPDMEDRELPYWGE